MLSNDPADPGVGRPIPHPADLAGGHQALCPIREGSSPRRTKSPTKGTYNTSTVLIFSISKFNQIVLKVEVEITAFTTYFLLLLC